jgi:uncharacterized membrane protein YedE/YeeE
MLTARRWSPYGVGIGIGVLSWITFLTMDKALGTSSSFVHAVAALGELVAPAAISGPSANAYMVKEISEKTPLIDWQVMLVLGVLLGSLVSSRLSGDHATECVPSLWSWRFGPSKAVRYGAAFVSGAVMLFGARMAGGCTSGHGISGGLQMAVSSWVFFLAMFASGVVTAFLLFGTEGRHHVHD